MTNRMTFSSVEEIKEAVSSHFTDSELENAVAVFLGASDGESGRKCLRLVLTHENPKVRALGLRVLQRAVRENALLEDAVQLCFDVERLGELQHWYSAILARYSLSSFGERLCTEISKRANAEFSARNIRALEMHRVEDADRKRLVLERVRKCAAGAAPLRSSGD